ncbi:bifunctional ADP-dependent NAD(P)H-hydrate dehydratase/NAD(P)H-hydrate epimerase [Hydrogenovibrio kuenenii]|uniref:bifunctional ADP-dependent NAD(P)H-hydrate dehydratase/NAD(P)H-hydrate epimerase n=1 Tax=Hydrogenovibrio kuenenii TaxID=63658 RepID=UPI000466588C|nr:bifunctional ADP-dependent NAD(P)H-hydrate dehydratase/NAD(P)H-hydrate epimerase [Hydrogenovibrio kuenenii]
MKLYSAEQSQQLDRLAIASGNFPGILLMKRAAYRAFQTLRQHWPQAKKLYILCGTGNNGGDGLALAQYAILEGLEVDIALVGNSDHFKPDAQQVFSELTQLGVISQNFSSAKLEEADLVVDALLGIGLNKDIEGKLSDIINQVSQAHKPILALDIPTGINATTGQIHGCAIRANVTISFITHKLGLYTGLGADHIGKKVIDDLNLPATLFEQIPSLADFHDLAYWQNKMPKRSIAAHKGSSGTSLLIGGNHSMAGAIQLAATAALRAGSGLVKVISQPGHLQTLTEQQPELMTYPTKQLEMLLTQVNAIAIGPGLGEDNWAQKLFQQTLQHSMQSPTPLVMDADALKLLAQNPQQRPTKPNWVLTPHPGEAAQMLGCSTQEVQSDRLAAIRKLHEMYGGVIVLKGNGSLIFDGEQMELCPLGNAGMAVGGMGDVLTGMITSYLAQGSGQGMTLMDAACLGVYQHAAIADQVIENRSLTSLIPSDIIDGL